MYHLTEKMRSSQIHFVQVTNKVMYTLCKCNSGVHNVRVNLFPSHASYWEQSASGLDCEDVLSAIVGFRIHLFAYHILLISEGCFLFQP